MCLSLFIIVYPGFPINFHCIEAGKVWYKIRHSVLPRFPFYRVENPLRHPVTPLFPQMLFATFCIIFWFYSHTMSHNFHTTPYIHPFHGVSMAGRPGWRTWWVWSKGARRQNLPLWTFLQTGTAWYGAWECSSPARFRNWIHSTWARKQRSRCRNFEIPLLQHGSLSRTSVCGKRFSSTSVQAMWGMIHLKHHRRNKKRMQSHVRWMVPRLLMLPRHPGQNLHSQNKERMPRLLMLRRHPGQNLHSQNKKRMPRLLMLPRHPGQNLHGQNRFSVWMVPKLSRSPRRGCRSLQTWCSRRRRKPGNWWSLKYQMLKRLSIKLCRRKQVSASSW